MLGEGPVVKIAPPPIIQEPGPQTQAERVWTLEEIRQMHDIQAWLDCMQYVEDELLHRKTREIRKLVINAVLASMAQEHREVSDSDFENATVKIRRITLPEDFDLYGGRRDFYVPTITFKNEDDQLRLFMKMDAWFRSSMTLHVPAKRFVDASQGVVTRFVPVGIRPVSTLMALSKGIGKTVQVHSGFAVDPLSLQRKDHPTDAIVGKWVGLLGYAVRPKDSRNLANELIADRTAYYEMVNPTIAKMERAESGMDELEATLLDGIVPNEEIERLVALSKEFTQQQLAEADIFTNSDFGKKAGFLKTGRRLTSTEDLITPLFNFLKKLVEKLGYGQALSLLMRSPSLAALAKELEVKHPEIDFAATAYENLDLIRKAIRGGVF